MRVGNPCRNKDYSTCHANNKIWLLLPLIIFTEWGTLSQTIYKVMLTFSKNFIIYVKIEGRC